MIRFLNQIIAIMKTQRSIHSAKAVLLAVLFFAPLSLLAQRPDFSGSWKLNRSQSKLMAEFTMAPQTLSIVQAGNNLTVDKVMDMMGQTSQTKEIYTLDGAECRNTGFMDMVRVSTANWDNASNKLTINSTLSFQGDSMNSVEEYYYDSDGHLVINSSTDSPMGVMAETYVFDKQ